VKKGCRSALGRAIRDLKHSANESSAFRRDHEFIDRASSLLAEELAYAQGIDLYDAYGLVRAQVQAETKVPAQQRAAECVAA
jgi:RNA polymerase-interacting CarD/CdnL/TRCF family regulator